MDVNFHTMGCHFQAEFNNSLTSREILKHLPINAEIKLWGEELYFETGIVASDFNASLDVSVGDVAYWPHGKCLCVFYGKTPHSKDAKPVPASPVVVIGKLKTIPAELRAVRTGQHIKVSLFEQKEKPVAAPVPAADNGAGERKLSQGEIDDLVKKLLAEREAKKQG
jgi:uncharacterized protein